MREVRGLVEGEVDGRRRVRDTDTGTGPGRRHGEGVWRDPRTGRPSSPGLPGRTTGVGTVEDQEEEVDREVDGVHEELQRYGKKSDPRPYPATSGV